MSATIPAPTPVPSPAAAAAPSASQLAVNVSSRPIVAALSHWQPAGKERRLWRELYDVVSPVAVSRARTIVNTLNNHVLREAGFSQHEMLAEIHALIMEHFIVAVQQHLPIANVQGYDVLGVLYFAVQDARHEINAMANHQRVSVKDRKGGRWLPTRSLNEKVSTSEDGDDVTLLDLLSAEATFDTPELESWKQLLCFLSDEQRRIVLVAWGLVTIDAPQMRQTLARCKPRRTRRDIRLPWATDIVLGRLLDMRASHVRSLYASAERQILSRRECVDAIRTRLLPFDAP